jgi:hypothetical protein
MKADKSIPRSMTDVVNLRDSRGTTVVCLNQPATLSSACLHHVLLADLRSNISRSPGPSVISQQFFTVGEQKTKLYNSLMLRCRVSFTDTNGIPP